MNAHRRKRGQALVEAGLVVVLFLGLSLGILTFGHAFMVANMITHAARDGARLAATWPSRGPCGSLLATAPIVTQVNTEIAAVTTQTFTVTFVQNPNPNAAAPCASAGSTPTVGVQLTGCVPWVFPLIPLNLGADCGGQKGFSVSRTVVFRDEGR